MTFECPNNTKEASSKSSSSTLIAGDSNLSSDLTTSVDPNEVELAQIAQRNGNVALTSLPKCQTLCGHHERTDELS